MPVIINDVITEVSPSVVPASTAQPMEERMPVAPPEYELMQTLSIVAERQARLQFD